jgi:uncharacterized damage-inducible protein DinB
MNDPLRTHLVKLLDWHDAHVDFGAAIDEIPSEFYGKQPQGLPYSPWQLLEHIRFTQRDILDFCRRKDYVEPHWPDDYWPKNVAPTSSDEWNKSVAAFKADREGMKQLAADASINLFDKIPHGQGQTYLREILLVADHNAYHIGQIVAVQRLLGIWK